MNLSDTHNDALDDGADSSDSVSVNDVPSGNASSGDAPSGDVSSDREEVKTAKQSRRVDFVSLVAGVLFIVVAALAVTDRHWASIDLISVLAAALVVLGVVIGLAVVVGHSRQRAS